jgi:hypothetical protein
MFDNRMLVECVVEERLAEARAAAARRRLIRQAPSRAACVRVALGRGLARMGQWLAGGDGVAVVNAPQP